MSTVMPKSLDEKTHPVILSGYIVKHNMCLCDVFFITQENIYPEPSLELTLEGYPL